MNFIIVFLIIMGIAIVLTPIAMAIYYSQEKSKVNKERPCVVKTKIIDSSHTATSSSQSKVGSAICRAAVGGFVAGPIGSIVGAGTAKQKTTVTEHHTTTFMIWYTNGTRQHKTVENNGDWYNMYMEKLDIE